MGTLGNTVDMRLITPTAGETADDATTCARRGLHYLPKRIQEIVAAVVTYWKMDFAPLDHLFLHDTGFMWQIEYDQILLTTHFGRHAAFWAICVNQPLRTAISTSGVA